MSGAPGRTDVGWIAATTIQQVTALAIARMQIAAAEKIAKRQAAIAEGYLAIAKELQDLWREHYKCLEIKATTESCAEEIYVPEYEEQAGRYAMSVKKQFQQAYEQLEQCLSPYCTGMRQLLTRDIMIEEARAVSDAVNYAYRYAESRAEALNDRRWTRMTELIGLGRGLVSMSLSYSQAAGELYSSLGHQAAISVAGAGKMLGYAFNRSYDNARPPKYGYQNQDQGYRPMDRREWNSQQQGNNYSNHNISQQFSQSSFNNVDSSVDGSGEQYAVGGTGGGNVMGGGFGLGGNMGVGTDFAFLGGAGVSGDK